MGKRRGMGDREFWDSALLNDTTYLMYYYRLLELAINRFTWLNLPEGVNERFLELTLNCLGYAVMFYDEILEQYLGLQCMINGKLNVYNIPIERTAYANNGYMKKLTDRDSVIFWNNSTRTPTMMPLELYSKKLYELDRAIDINIMAQKTPILITGVENQMLSLKNLYMKYDGGKPVIFGDKSLNPDTIRVLKTDAPLVAKDLQLLKNQIWNEALTYLGFLNNSSEKREREVDIEAASSIGHIEGQRNTFLNSRLQCAKEFNEMFGTDISVEFNSEIALYDLITPPDLQPDKEVVENE